jgi:predicted deacetylase
VVKRCFAISVHDVSPSTWPECLRLLAMTDDWAVPVSLLVVPNFHFHGTIDENPQFAAALRARVELGDEIVLHGFSHLDDAPSPRTPGDWWQRRVHTAREGEMAALGAAECRRRLEAGLAMLAGVSLNPAGFIAPAWLLGAGAREALAHLPFAYTCTRDELLPLPRFEPVAAPSLVYSSRSRWRRALSRVWNDRRLAALESSPLVRVALHPIDARYPGVIAHWRRIIARLAAERSAVLESSWLAAHVRG